MSVHPVTLEVVRNALVAYAEDMATALCKSAYNMMIYEVRDFCCGLIDTNGQMISQNKGGIPIFLADLGVAVLDGIERYGLDGFQPGDVVIMNHAQICGQHLNNVVIYTPCFHDGNLVAFAANRAHWVDVGGMRVGFGSYATSEIFQEGLQFRSIKIYEAGERNDAVWQILTDNLRFPDSSLGDLRAQIASCNLGERRLAEIFVRYGTATVDSCIAEIWKQAEAEAREIITAIPDGSYSAESFLDNDGRTLDKPLRVRVTVIVDGDEMTVDYADMNPQVPTPLNSGYSGGLAAARVAFKCLTMPEAPVNEGCFRPLHLNSPEGTIVNAKPQAAIGLWSIMLPTVIDTILRALAPVMPDKVPAAHKGDMGGVSFYGYREEDGQRFLLLNIFGGGWGGRPGGDGESASVSICQGDVRNVPVEVQETNYPFMIDTFALRPDSGGAGKYRGGLGIEITYRCLQKTSANIDLERTVDPPWGILGGAMGKVSQAILRRTDGSVMEVTKQTDIMLDADDTITFLTAGGGGYGAVEDRGRNAIKEDLREGLVTPDGAAIEYGFMPTNTIDDEASQ